MGEGKFLGRSCLGFFFNVMGHIGSYMVRRFQGYGWVIKTSGFRAAEGSGLWVGLSNIASLTSSSSVTSQHNGRSMAK